jgi:hypothetical protein
VTVLSMLWTSTAQAERSGPGSRLIFYKPNIEISCYLSAPYTDRITGEKVRHFSFTVFNDGPVACGPNTTLMQLEVGDPDSMVGTAISVHPFENPGMDSESGWVYHATIPDAEFIRVDLWADYDDDVDESNEGDNYEVCVPTPPLAPGGGFATP